MSHSLLRHRSSTDQSVFRLEEHLELWWNVVSDQRWNADPQIDEIAGMELSRDAPGDDYLSVHESPVRNQVVDERCRGHDVIGCDDPYGHDVLRRYDHGICRHRHDRVEITCGQRVGEVTEVISQKGVNQGKLRPQCSLEQKRSSVYLDLALAFGHRGADAGWREHAPEPATARANAFDEGPLGYEIDGDLIGQHLLLGLWIE